MILIALSSLLGVVSLFLCKSLLMSWGVIFSEFNKEASLFIAIISRSNVTAKLEFEVVAIQYVCAV